MVPPCWSFIPINKPPPSAVVVITWWIVSHTSSFSSCSRSREEGVSAALDGSIPALQATVRGVFLLRAGPRRPTPAVEPEEQLTHTQLWPEQLRQIMTGWDCAGKSVFIAGKQQFILSLAVVTVLYSLDFFYEWSCASDYCQYSFRKFQSVQQAWSCDQFVWKNSNIENSLWIWFNIDLLALAVQDLGEWRGNGV